MKTVRIVTLRSHNDYSFVVQLRLSMVSNRNNLADVGTGSNLIWESQCLPASIGRNTLSNGENFLANKVNCRNWQPIFRARGFGGETALL